MGATKAGMSRTEMVTQGRKIRALLDHADARLLAAVMAPESMLNDAAKANVIAVWEDVKAALKLAETISAQSKRG
jgi:hypothetical protein